MIRFAYYTRHFPQIRWLKQKSLSGSYAMKIEKGSCQLHRYIQYTESKIILFKIIRSDKSTKEPPCSPLYPIYIGERARVRCGPYCSIYLSILRCRIDQKQSAVHMQGCVPLGFCCVRGFPSPLSSAFAHAFSSRQSRAAFCVSAVDSSNPSGGPRWLDAVYTESVVCVCAYTLARLASALYLKNTVF